MAFDYWNMLSQSPAKYIPKAVSNISNRLMSTPQYQYGAGGIPTWQNLKKALTPQTAYAAPSENQQITSAPIDYSTAGLNFNIPNPNQTTTEPTTDGGGTTEPPPWQGVYNGVIYNDIQSYTDAVNADINKKYNDAIKIIDQNYQNGIINLDTRNSQIEATRANLAEQHATNLGNVQGTFSKLAPEALQSAQGDYTNKIDTSFNQANAQLGSLPQNYRTMTPEQLAQFSDPTNPNYLTESGGLARDYANLVSGYGTQQQSATDWANQQKNNIISNFLNASENYTANNQPIPASNMSDFANYFAQMQFTPMQGMVSKPPVMAQVANDPNKKNTTPIAQYANV